MRAVLAHSGPKRSLEERLDVQRRLRERAKRLADAVPSCYAKLRTPTYTVVHTTPDVMSTGDYLQIRHLA